MFQKANWHPLSTGTTTDSLQTIRLLAGQLTGYTDGSKRAGTKDDGAGVIVTCGDPADPTILHRCHLRGAAFTSSFAEEAAAMQIALEWANHPEHSLPICTDSQSLLKAIERRSPVTHHIRSLLNARPAPTTNSFTTSKLADSGGVWRVLLVQRLHGH